MIFSFQVDDVIPMKKDGRRALETHTSAKIHQDFKNQIKDSALLIEAFKEHMHKVLDGAIDNALSREPDVVESVKGGADAEN